MEAHVIDPPATYFLQKKKVGQNVTLIVYLNMKTLDEVRLMRLMICSSFLLLITANFLPTIKNNPIDINIMFKYTYDQLTINLPTNT